MNEEIIEGEQEGEKAKASLIFFPPTSVRYLPPFSNLWLLSSPTIFAHIYPGAVGEQILVKVNGEDKYVKVQLISPLSLPLPFPPSSDMIKSAIEKIQNKIKNSVAVAGKIRRIFLPFPFSEIKKNPLELHEHEKNQDICDECGVLCNIGLWYRTAILETKNDTFTIIIPHFENEKDPFFASTYKTSPLYPKVPLSDVRSVFAWWWEKANIVKDSKNSLPDSFFVVKSNKEGRILLSLNISVPRIPIFKPLIDEQEFTQAELELIYRLLFNVIVKLDADALYELEKKVKVPQEFVELFWEKKEEEKWG